MSVIQTIRNRYGKIAGAVIAIALVGFIVSDARNGSFGNLFGGHDSNVMKINGVKIDPKEYQQRIKEYARRPAAGGATPLRGIRTAAAALRRERLGVTRSGG